MIIIGGKDANEDSDSNVSNVVEEIDFLKRNIVNLASLKQPRANANAFMVNDSIYVMGGC